MRSSRTSQQAPNKIARSANGLGRLRLPVVAVVLLAGLSGAACGDEPSPERSESKENQRYLVMKTLGGRQFWGDVHFFHEWRIQRNVFTGHYRLIDGDDNRHMSGTFPECLDRLQAIRKKRKLPPMTGKAVLLLHGIIRSSKSMSKLCRPFEERGYHVFSFDYPSTQIDIPEAAAYLNRAIESLEGIEEINFIVHSMGGLVVRAYLTKHRDPRIERMVMMGVPNLGADMANRVRDLGLYRAIFGPAGQQLVKDAEGFIACLPTPDFEFAIIAGARGTLNGYNPLIPGDDDGTVSVASTRLPGAADFITVPALHSFIMRDERAVEFAVRFITEGQLRAEGSPHPIPVPEEEQTKSVEPSPPPVPSP